MSQIKAEEPKVFLSAEWCSLIHLSYYVKPELLQAVKPPNIELDMIGANAVVSLVAFDFKNTGIKGVPVPVYGNFPEVNLRYYVKDRDNRYSGVVFIKELVPRALVAAAANSLYNEKYEAANITCETKQALDVLEFNYTVEEHSVTAITEARSVTPQENSTQHWVKQRNAGFGIIEGKTIVYKVEHGIWEIYPVINYSSRIDFGKVFGGKWSFLNNEEPFDVTVAKGSMVNIYEWEFYEY